MNKKEQVESAVISGDVVYVDVSTKKHPYATMICDLSSFIEWACKKTYGKIYPFQCKCHNYPYAQFANNISRRKKVLFHRMVRPDLRAVDHINRIGLDNRAVNLRDGSGGVNEWNQKASKRNKSGYRGVSFSTDKRKWCAKITTRGKTQHLGYFKTASEAGEAYRVASVERDRLAGCGGKA